MSSMQENSNLNQAAAFLLPPSFESLASNGSNGDDSNWFGRIVTYISDGFRYITDLFSHAISSITSSIPSFSTILRSIASSILPNPRMKAAAYRRSNQNHFFRPHNIGLSSISAPLENLLTRPDHVTGFVAKEELKTIDFPPSSSISYAPLVSVLKDLSLTPCLETLLAANELPTKNENIEKLKAHLLAIVNFLRGDSSQNINKDHLTTAWRLFLRIDRDMGSRSLEKSRTNPELLFLNLCSLFGATFDQVKEIILGTFISNIDQLKLLQPKDEALELVTPDSVAHLEEDSIKIHNECRAVLKKIAFSDDFMAILSCDTYTEEPKTDASLQEMLLHSKTEIFRKTLKNSLFALVQKIRKNDPKQQVTIDEQKALIKLMIIAENQNQNIDRDLFLAKIGAYLKLESPPCVSLQKELFMEKINFSNMLLNPPEELASVNESCIMGQLTNIGSTCYLDSAVWMIARFESFDSILLSELPSNLTGLDLELVNALRQQLKGVVHELRSGNPISRQSSETLYQLLRANGWPHQLGTMQDPHELLTFLFAKFLKDNAKTPFSFFTNKCLSWQDPAHTDPLTKFTSHQELNYDLQLGPMVKSTGQNITIDPSIDSMKGIFDFNLVTSVPDYHPESGSVDECGVQAEIKTFFFGDAPKILSVLQKRYISGQRLNGSIPVFSKDDAGIMAPTLTIPFYTSEEDLSIKEEKTYKLKGVICHQGSSVHTGHYTFLSLQKIEVKGKEPVNAWVNYNDMSSQPNKFQEGTKQIADLQRLVNQQGFYLIYEEDTSISKDSPAELFLDQ